jgi:cobalamin-dependent methionine synthase I
MLCIGENINIMSKTIGPAIKEKNAEPIRKMVKEEAKNGMDFIDLNIGPARKGGPETMEWLVKNVQEVANLPLSLDTTNLDAMEAGLKVHKGVPIMNSVSLQPERLDRGIKMAKEYNCNVIALLWGKEGMPRDENERAVHVVEFYQRAMDAGISAEKIWVDPIVSPVSVEINQVKACVAFMGMLQEIVPGVKSIIGLSNISNGTPDHLRPWLNRTYACMLIHQGVYSAIVDAYDAALIDIARGKRPDIIEVVVSVMEGRTVNTDDLSEELLKYYKSARVLTGQTLYSHSWLEI